MTSNTPMTGIVKWFDTKKGYGFIQEERNGVLIPTPDYFVHYSNILAKGYRELKEGERVQFEPFSRHDNRWCAIKVISLTPPQTTPQTT